MRKEKFVYIILLLLMLLISTSPVVFAGKSFYWLVTDGDIDPQFYIYNYQDQYVGEGLYERIAQFQWYVDRGISRSGTLTGLDKPISGTKATFSMSSLGNDLVLNVQIYRGKVSDPSAGPEIYKWTIADGKSSSYTCISVGFTNLINGQPLSVVSLYENDIAYIGLPNLLKFECRMQLI
jgi:hypothetical protein